MKFVQRHYPMQGSRAFETTSMPVVTTFRYSCSANTATGTTVGPYFPQGSMILGFQGVVTAAFTSTGSSTLTIGFTGLSQLSATTALTSIDAVGDILGAAVTNVPVPCVLAADDSFDFAVKTAKMSAGNMDIHVLHVPPADGAADSTFKLFAAT